MHPVIALEALDPGLQLLTLDRPAKRNALTRELIEQLTLALRDAARDPTVRGVILNGAGKSFCAGVDLHEFAQGTVESGRRLIEALRDLCATVRTLPKPVVCAIHGHCLGGALELAACCDFRVCTPDAQLGMPEVLLGIPSVIDAVMLTHHVGAGRARELLLTGDPIDGETAYAWGLANRLAPPEAFVRTAADLLRQVTRHAPEVIAAQKTLHQQWLDLPYSEAVERSIEPLLDAVRAGRPEQAARALLER